MVPGIEIGAAVFVLLIAKAAGAWVIVTSRRTKKCQQAIELGADLAIHSESDWNVALNGKKVDLVIDSVRVATWSRALSILKQGRTLVNFEATSGQKLKSISVICILDSTIS